MNNRDRSILVTGASSGIGLECALRLARETNFRVFAGVRREGDAARIRAYGLEGLEPISLDVRDPQSVARARGRLENSLYALVNNAGIAAAGPLELLSVQTVEEQFQVNVFGLLRVTQTFLPRLREVRGRVVNVGSIAGKVASPMTGAYAASKHAVEGLSDALRRELRPWGIEVSVIEPGFVKTPIWERSEAWALENFARAPLEGQALYRDTLERLLANLHEIVPRAAGPEPVARAVLHALTARRPRTRYVVGRDAKLGNLLRHLPDRWFDSLLLRNRVGRR